MSQVSTLAAEIVCPRIASLASEAMRLGQTAGGHVSHVGFPSLFCDLQLDCRNNLFLCLTISPMVSKHALLLRVFWQRKLLSESLLGSLGAPELTPRRTQSTLNDDGYYRCPGARGAGQPA